MPFRVARVTRANGDPSPLPYLDDSEIGHPPAVDLTVEVYLATATMRAHGDAPVRLSRGNLRELYWSFAQMVAHHTANGCNLNAGDLLGSGTVSGAIQGSEGCLLERTRYGTVPLRLPGGETRTFLEDGDEIILSGFCEREGLRISFGDCRGIIEPAIAYP